MVILKFYHKSQVFRSLGFIFCIENGAATLILSATAPYNTDELNELNKYLEDMYEKTGSTIYLSVMVNFLLGLRVGELVALKWSDIDEDYLCISREAVRNEEVNGESKYVIVEHTKTYSERKVVLTDSAKKILNRIETGNEFIFNSDGKPFTTRQIAYVLEKYAQTTGTTLKSSHKMRKTYASMLNAAGVPVDCIREILGHSNLSTTYSYIYNPLTEKETINLINNTLN